MYTILLLQPCGWTDNIGQQSPEDNRWNGYDDAMDALDDLRSSGVIDGTARVVSLSDLGQYDLIG